MLRNIKRFAKIAIFQNYFLPLQCQSRQATFKFNN